MSLALLRQVVVDHGYQLLGVLNILSRTVAEALEVDEHGLGIGACIGKSIGRQKQDCKIVARLDCAKNVAG